MAVTAFWYGSGFLAILNKEVDWAADAIKVALLHDYTPDQDAHNYFDDVSAVEIAAGSGYSDGGMLLPTPTIGYTGATNVVKLSGGACVWTASTIHATHAVIYDSTPGSAATNPLLGYVVFGADVDSINSTFTITWDAAGIFTITPA